MPPIATAVTARPVEAVASYARRVGDDVKIVLTLPDDLRDEVGDGLTRRRVWLRLGRNDGTGPQRVRALAQVTPGARPRLEVRVPADSLTPGTYKLALRVGKGGAIVPLEARLLMTDTDVQPLALLAGPRPLTRLPEPEPR
ncbi:hypothetical protein [Nocardioides rubriscoriae]|uniref:hypothetical protein n=1 Tax=Nocardioides rubriscoriae TaxID=642762 RepID=UPI0014790115|nr:hypothetical protein [Nocardioides rubriscoriae]